MLVFVECNVLVLIPPSPLTIIVEVLQLFFCSCGLPGHMVMAKESLVDAKEHCLTILHTFSLFQVDTRVCVLEHLPENLIHKGIVYLKCK